MSARVAVVHLVRAANGFEPFDRFMRSYEQHEAGRDHDLVLLFKGFKDEADLMAYRRRAAAHHVDEIHVSDDGLDVTAYRVAANDLGQEVLCFLNSYSAIEAPHWLRLLTSPLLRPDVGVVGATGSWGSHRSFAMYLLRLPTPYTRVLRDRAALRDALRSLGPGGTAASNAPPSLGRRVFDAAKGVPRELIGYRRFPAPHVRTNAFAMRREVFLSLNAGPLRTKRATYRFEGGKRGMTEQLRARGLEVLIVASDGRTFRPHDWADSGLFWQGGQEGLVVSDNQTRAYAEGTPAQRRALAAYAWAWKARPS